VRQLQEFKEEVLLWQFIFGDVTQDRTAPSSPVAESKSADTMPIIVASSASSSSIKTYVGAFVVIRMTPRFL
jgi:hypothetical protein